MTAWHRALNEYLAVRRSVGFKLEEAERVLPRFVTYLERRHARTITSDLAHLWAVRLGLVRGFARYQQAFDPRTEVPPPELLPQRRRRATPFLYSKEEVRRLVRAARRLSPPLYAWTYTSLIGLLASTGMRRGEVIRLDREDVDWIHGLVVVRKSKFGKSRELPLHPTTIGALRAYARMRDRLCPRPTSRSFFVSLRGTRLLPHRVHLTFRRVVERAEIAPRSAHCRPRLHDLRHSFAVRTMLDWYRAGVDVESRLPLLSTYLGHFDPSTTYWYLSAAPELFALVARRLERASGVLS